MLKEILKATRIKEIMATPAITIHERDEFHVVYDKFETYDIRHLPVINDAGTIVGLISQRQLFKVHSPRKLEDGSWYYDKEELDEFILKNVMEANPFTLRPEEDLHKALGLMVNSKLGCIPIVDDNRRPAGVLTRADFLKFFLTK